MIRESSVVPVVRYPVNSSSFIVYSRIMLRSIISVLLLGGSVCGFVQFRQPFVVPASYRSTNAQLYANINFRNFWIGTVANYTSCEAPDREPNFESRSGSKYWNVNDTTVIRQSDHWTGQHGVRRIVDCVWTLDREHEFEEISTGQCSFDQFVKIKKKGRKTLRERGVEIKQKKEKVELVKINVTFANFWRSTEAHFEACNGVPDREPDFQSKSGSRYWDEGSSVIRLSDHWSGQQGITKIVDCRWTIDKQLKNREPVSAQCMYDNFVKRNKSKKGSKRTWRKLRSR